MNKTVKKAVATLLLACMILTAFALPVFSAGAVSITSLDLDDGNLDKIYFKVETDKDLAEYAVGEEMTFSVSLWADTDTDTNKDNDTLIGAPYFYWTVKGDDGSSDSGYAVGTSGMATVKASLGTPGAVRLEIEPADAGKNIIKHGKITKFEGGAMANASEIQVSTTEPSDFDEFWAGQLELLDAVEPELLSVREIENPDPSLKSYEVHIACVENTCPTTTGTSYASAIISYPENASRESLKMNVELNGYGVTDNAVPYAGGWSGTIWINVYAHSAPLDKEKSYYDELWNGTLDDYGFDAQENADPETSYFRGMILRDLQAVRFLKKYFGEGVESVVDGVDTSAWAGLWNGDHLKVYGGSQGGFQSLAVAAFDHDVTEVNAGIPWFSDVAGNTAPEKIQSTFRPDYASGLAYYDSAFLAKRIKAPMVNITGGTGDTLCPMVGVQAIYNNLDVSYAAMTFTQGGIHGASNSYPIESRQIKVSSADLSGIVDTEYSKYTWGFDIETRVLTITSASSDWNAVGNTFENYYPGSWGTVKDSVEEVVIKGNFQSLTWNAFSDHKALRKVTMPTSVTAISDNAFNNCPKLSEICYEGDAYLPGTVDLSRVTGKNSNLASQEAILQGAASVKTLVLNDAYTEATPLLESNIPENLERIMGPHDSAYLRAFCETKGLEFIPYGKTKTGNAAWIYDGATKTVSVFGTGKVSGIAEGDVAFLSNAETLTLDENLTELSSDAFASLSGLTNVTINGDAPKVPAGARPFGAGNVVITVSGDAAGFSGKTWCGYALNIITFKPGDVNCDKAIDAKDAVLLAQYLANWEVSVDSYTSDCNGDMKTDAKDAVLLAQYLANWDVTLGGDRVPEPDRVEDNEVVGSEEFFS